MVESRICKYSAYVKILFPFITSLCSWKSSSSPELKERYRRSMVQELRNDYYCNNKFIKDKINEIHILMLQILLLSQQDKPFYLTITTGGNSSCGVSIQDPQKPHPVLPLRWIWLVKRYVCKICKQCRLNKSNYIRIVVFLEYIRNNSWVSQSRDLFVSKH